MARRILACALLPLAGIAIPLCAWIWLHNLDLSGRTFGDGPVLGIDAWTPRALQGFFTACSADASTFSPALVLVMLAIAFRRARVVARGGALAPLDPRFEKWFLMAGLAGTLVGMVLAASGPDPAGSDAALLGGLRAALLSTLTALALAFLVVPLLEWTLQAAPPPDLESAASRLVAEVTELAEAMGKLGDRTESANEAMADLVGKLSAPHLKLIQDMSKLIEALIRATEEQSRRESRLAGEIESLKQTMHGLIQENDRMRDRIQRRDETARTRDRRVLSLVAEVLNGNHDSTE